MLRQDFLREKHRAEARRRDSNNTVGLGNSSLESKKPTSTKVTLKYDFKSTPQAKLVSLSTTNKIESIEPQSCSYSSTTTKQQLIQLLPTSTNRLAMSFAGST